MIVLLKLPVQRKVFLKEYPTNVPLIFVIDGESKNVPSVISIKMEITCSIFQVEKFHWLNVLEYNRADINRVKLDSIAHNAYFKASLKKCPVRNHLSVRNHKFSTTSKLEVIGFLEICEGSSVLFKVN